MDTISMTNEEMVELLLEAGLDKNEIADMSRDELIREVAKHGLATSQFGDLA